MHKKSNIVTAIVVAALGLFLFACVTMPKPTKENFKAPSIALESVAVTQYDGYWYFSKKIKPLKGEAGNYGAPLPMSFVFNITNPNKYPVRLDDFRFTIAFEDFDVNMVQSTATQWIPAGKTNQIAVPSMLTTRQTLLTLLVPNALKVKAKGTNAWALLEKWWKGVPNYSVPIFVKGGAATFSANGVEKIVPFSARFPQ